MFVHQQRLLLFVAAALAVAMNFGSMLDAQAASVPGVYRRNNNWLQRRQDAIINGNNGGGNVRRSKAAERSLGRRRAAMLQRRRQRTLQTDTDGTDEETFPEVTPVSSVSASMTASPSASGSPTPDSTLTETITMTVTETVSESTPPATVTVTSTSTSTATASPTVCASPTVTPDDPTTTTTSASTTEAPPTVTPADPTPTTTTTTTASSSSTTMPASQSTGVPYPIATVTTGAGTPLVLQSNNADYGWDEASADLNAIMSWAGDDGNLTDDEKTETLAAILSGAARFWPELPTRVMVRIMLADIRAESDFRPRAVGGERLDSGASLGLLQLSPGGGANWLPWYKQHFNAATHNFTWGIDAPNVRAGVRGKLIDWQTGEMINLSALTNEDLYRPWVNIHASMFIQSNHARTASADAWLWEQLNDYSWALKQAKTTTLTASQNATYTSYLAGAGLSRTPKTALGSWVAGSATNGWGSYTSAGDDVSANYFTAIMKGVSFLYNGANGAVWQPEWLERWTVNAGLTDYI